MVCGPRDEEIAGRAERVAVTEPLWCAQVAHIWPHHAAIIHRLHDIGRTMLYDVLNFYLFIYFCVFFLLIPNALQMPVLPIEQVVAPHRTSGHPERDPHTPRLTQATDPRRVSHLPDNKPNRPWRPDWSQVRFRSGSDRNRKGCSWA